MTWEQKLQAMQSLCSVLLKMRKPGDWYVSQSIEVADGGLLRGEYGNGINPEKAVEDHWTQLTNLPVGNYLVYQSVTGQKCKVTWNGFMWEVYA